MEADLVLMSLEANELTVWDALGWQECNFEKVGFAEGTGDWYTAAVYPGWVILQSDGDSTSFLQGGLYV